MESSKKSIPSNIISPSHSDSVKQNIHTIEKLQYIKRQKEWREKMATFYYAWTLCETTFSTILNHKIYGHY
jgi:hypothetical protein